LSERFDTASAAGDAGAVHRGQRRRLIGLFELDVLDQRAAIARLSRWFGRHARALPWRRRRTPYRVVVAEIMLQQTRAETVAVYPPGIPAVYPGEEITPEIVNYLTTIRELKLPCQGPSDSTLKTLKVVIE